MATASCQLCSKERWQTFSHIAFGLWDTTELELKRQHSLYPLSQCQHCGHVQVSVQYTNDLFAKLYFHSAQEAVMWHESLIASHAPYQEMINFALSGLDDINNLLGLTQQSPKTVVDFGCGEGKLLAATQAALPDSELVGIDFNDRFSQTNIRYLAFDLNNLEQLTSDAWPQGIDLAMASHVLEHVINPVEFLRGIKQQLSPKGAIFIEVPDFSAPHPLPSIGMSNLVNLQHIHYFSLDSLQFAAKQAGLRLIKQARVITGYIPRLQVLLQAANDIALNHDSTQPESHTVSTVNAVSHYQHQCQQLRAQLAAKVRAAITRHGKAGLWGIGADFYLLISEHTDLLELIASRQLALFDYSLAGKHYHGQTIACSSKLANAIHPTFLCPLLAETRIKMRAISQEWQQVVDPFFKGI